MARLVFLELLQPVHGRRPEGPGSSYRTGAESDCQMTRMPTAPMRFSAAFIPSGGNTTECQPALAIAPSYVHSYFWRAEASVRSGKPTEANEFVDKTERLDARNRPAWEAGKGLPTWAICGSDSHLQVVLRVEPECRVDARLADRCP
jgi:hypothetical protein